MFHHITLIIRHWYLCWCLALLPNVLCAAASYTTTHGSTTATATSVLQLPLHPCCCWSFLPTLRLHCSLLSSRCIVLPIALLLLLLHCNSFTETMVTIYPTTDILVGLESLMMLKLSLLLSCAPSSASALLQRICASRIAANTFVPSCTTATSFVPLALLQPQPHCYR